LSELFCSRSLRQWQSHAPSERSAIRRRCRKNGLTIIETTRACCAPDQQLDLLDAFGPMSAMHAAMDKVGVGMPCGLIVRFQRKPIAEVAAAVEAARLRFPVLQRRVAWIGNRPVLVKPGASTMAARTSTISLTFTSGPDGRLWRYSLVPDGDDTW